MNKLIISFILLVTNSIFIFPQNDLKLVYEFSQGSSLDEIDFTKYTPTQNLVLDMCFDINGNLLINDNGNNRIVIYNSTFSKISTIYYSEIGIDKGDFVYNMYADNKSNLYLITYNNYIIKLNNNYVLEFKILKSILGSNIRRDYLYYAYNSFLFINDNVNSEETFFISDEYTFKKIENNNSFIIDSKSKIFKINEHKIAFSLHQFSNLNILKSGSYYFKSIDSANNFYFYKSSSKNPEIVIIDVNGNLKNKIIMDYLGPSNICISFSGDIFILDKDPERLRLFKIENTWSPEAKRLWQENISGQKSNELVVLTTTSLLTEPKDKNAYHPVKLFDNDPKTMWIENAKGPGIGEKISFSFAKDIIVDKITFQPGCFWDKYWKQNYRVKKMRMKLDDKNYTLDFDDEMKDQGITFNEPISFSEIELIIEAVYESTKWEDTAISGIKFFLNGEEIKIDTSKYAEGFEVKK